MSLPSTTKAFTVNSIRSPPDITIASIPVPTPVAPGTCAVRILSAYVSPGWPLFYDGTLSYLSFPVPFVPGSQAVGRVISAGPDAALLRPGDLVFIDSYIRARDDPINTQILLGLHEGSTEASKRLMRDAWRDGVLRTVATVPLENVHRLDEPAIDRLGYTPSELVIALSRLLVASGGVAAADLRAGQTVIVGPATGHYSGAVAEVAVALGARVIALGRDGTKLQAMSDALATIYPHRPRIQTVETTGDAEAVTSAIRAALPTGSPGADAFFDISPGSGVQPAHVAPAFAALRPGAKAILMGAVFGDLQISYASLLFRSITVKGQYMYTREDATQMMRMVEAGVVRIGKLAGHEVQGEFVLEDWEAAFATLKGAHGWGKGVTFTPGDEA